MKEETSPQTSNLWKEEKCARRSEDQEFLYYVKGTLWHTTHFEAFILFLSLPEKIPVANGLRISRRKAQK